MSYLYSKLPETGVPSLIGTGGLLDAAIAAGQAKREDGSIGYNPEDMSPEFLEVDKQLSALHPYALRLERETSLHVLLGKFEPPGTAVFQYAMEQRAEAAARAE
jgi:hypothetical protein